jgi:HAD-hyrolase-like
MPLRSQCRAGDGDQMSFGSAYLAVLDFDGTIAQTFVPSPNGVDVHRAYEVAIAREFGAPMLRSYVANGRNCSGGPSHVIDTLMPHASTAEKTRSVERLVEAKLNILLHEIGADWPIPVEGFLCFWNALQSARKNGRSIYTAILSSGHDAFIKKTFAAWGVPRAGDIDIVITHETIVSMAGTTAMHKLWKPSGALIAYIYAQWFRLCGVTVDTLGDARNRVVLIGDDMDTDGVMAARAGIRFVHVTRSNPAGAWQTMARVLHLRMPAPRSVSPTSPAQ